MTRRRWTSGEGPRGGAQGSATDIPTSGGAVIVDVGGELIRDPEAELRAHVARQQAFAPMPLGLSFIRWE